MSAGEAGTEAAGGRVRTGLVSPGFSGPEDSAILGLVRRRVFGYNGYTEHSKGRDWP